MKELIGGQVNQYHLQEIAGEGGMAVVYRAFDLKRKRVVAFKALKPIFGSNSAHQKRFFQEARAYSRLSHPNIVRLLDQGEGHVMGQHGKVLTAAPLTYLILDYMKEGTFARRLQRKGILAPAEAAVVLNQVARALDYAHQQKVIHRDIKPSNILINNNNYIVSDFSIARLVDAATRLTVSSSGFIGTALYASPEQIHGHEVDHRTDIYALGVMAYEMLSGQLPLDASRYENQVALLHALANSEPIPLRKVNRHISSELERVVLRALARKPADRYSSAGRFAAEFGRSAAAQFYIAKGEPVNKPAQVNKPVPVIPPTPPVVLPPPRLKTLAPEYPEWLLPVLVGVGIFMLMLFLLLGILLTVR